ncbi:phosphoglycolate phosphatase [Halobacteriales archaeon QS_1_67_19]|nr:MAG: phosphoglycolate phosphatase [Halobacteriales archaeon QS_1_67_19]
MTGPTDTHFPRPAVPRTVTRDEDVEAVVYDLDGTLVRLAVDWAAVERRLADLLASEGVEADELIAAAEREGARQSRRLALADAVADHGVPVGICSLNHEEAVRIALDEHGLTDHVEAVVGRGTVPERKPRPEPLLAAIERLGADPEDVVFVGDSEGDAEAAERAGTRFEWV